MVVMVVVASKSLAVGFVVQCVIVDELVFICPHSLWQAILLGLGLQHRTVESLSEELNNLAIGQILGIFNQLIRQIQTVEFLPVVKQSHCYLLLLTSTVIL